MKYQIWVEPNNISFVCQHGKVAIYPYCEATSTKYQDVYEFIKDIRIETIFISNKIKYNTDIAKIDILSTKELSHLNIDNTEFIHEHYMGTSLYCLQFESNNELKVDREPNPKLLMDYQKILNSVEDFTL